MFTIDGKNTDALPGMTVLEAARAAGIEIPISLIRGHSNMMALVLLRTSFNAWAISSTFSFSLIPIGSHDEADDVTEFTIERFPLREENTSVLAYGFDSAFRIASTRSSDSFPSVDGMCANVVTPYASTAFFIRAFFCASCWAFFLLCCPIYWLV